MSQNLRVEEGDLTKLIVTHKGKDLTFIHPKHSPGTYAQVAQKIDNANLARPIMSETVSLVHKAFNSNDEAFQEIINIVKDNWLWGFTGTLTIPREGVYIQDNPEIRDGFAFMDRSDLVKRLEDNDPDVRFVSVDFEIGHMPPRALAKNPFVIGLVGEEGAEKLAQLSDKFEDTTYLWSEGGYKANRTSIVVYAWGTDWTEHYGSMRLVGFDAGHNSDAYAFGIQKTGEASRAEK